jgi:hypothetical protein
MIVEKERKSIFREHTNQFIDELNHFLSERYKLIINF